MKDDTNRHPGPWRVMGVDSETAGILVAVGFLAMGLVGISVARWFVLGCLALGGAFAVLFRFVPQSVLLRIVGTVIGTVIVLIVAVTWWAGRVPRRPHTLSSSAVYVLPNNVPHGFFQTGYWLECWFDQQENDDRCKITDKNGNAVFEDVFVTCGIQATVPQSDLVFEPGTGRRWIQLRNEKVNVRVIYVRYGTVLVPRSLYTEVNQRGFC